MFPIRVKVCQESDLRMLGDLARNIQRVLPVTQADIDAAAALGKGWVVWKVIEVSDPLDNLRGGTQLIIKQNSVQPGQNVRRVIFVSGPGGETVVIGPAPSPLLLPDAIANSLSYVKAFGGTEQNGTPTPDAPVDIVSNNGVLKARHQSGLPLGYTLLEYIQSTGTQYIDTRLTTAPNTTSIRVISDVAFLEYPTGSSIFYISTPGAGLQVYLNRQLLYNQGASKPVKLNTFYNVDTITTDTSRSVALNGGEPATQNFSRSITNDAPIFVFNTNFKAKLRSQKFYINNSLVRDFVPAKNSSGVVGLYDLADANPATAFYTNAGTGDFVAGDPINDLEIYVDGTVETIKDSLNNTATAEMMLKVGDYQDVQSILDGVVTRNVGIKVLDGTEDWFAVTGYSNLYGLAVADGVFGSNKLPMSTHYQGTTANNASMSDNTVKATTATVLAPNKVSIYIKDGANSTLENFKQYLATQYANGTPVIVVYPLATPTTESVAGQTLQVDESDNTLTITQASILDLELEAEYEQGVEALVEEIEP